MVPPKESTNVILNGIIVRSEISQEHPRSELESKLCTMAELAGSSLQKKITKNRKESHFSWITELVIALAHKLTRQKEERRDHLIQTHMPEKFSKKV